jgi:predicted ribosome quality control (RQC) complex YloA/Tae2 family protein
MKDLSCLDISKIVEELKFLEGGKIEQIYMPDKKELILQIYQKDLKKQLLRISVPSYIYLTEFKPETDMPPGFCVFLRKKIKKSKIESIEQIPDERIIKIKFSFSEMSFYMYIELFLKGNVILCDENNKILSPMENQNWTDRTIRGGIDYILPQKEIKELNSDLEKPIGKFIATDMNLGGLYSNEILKRTKIDKNLDKLSKLQLDKLNKEINLLKKIKPKGFVYKLDDNVEAISPFDLKYFEDEKYSKEEFESFNIALNTILSHSQKEKIKEVKSKTQDVKKNKFEKIIESQTKNLNDANKKIEENTKKGELIYSNYNLIKEIIETINNARKTHSWKEIEAKLKDHKIIKKIDSKTGKISLELE